MSRKTKVAIIDDEHSILISTSLLLDLLGYSYITFHRPDKALEYLNINNDIDIILLDLMMPKIDGYEFLKRLNPTTSKRAKIILHTGVETQEHIDKCLAIGASDCLKKPYTKKDLAEILQRNTAED